MIARRFGWTRAIEVMALWIARQSLHYREAYVFRLDLARIPPLAGCERFEWRYARPAEIDPPLNAGLPSEPDGRPRCFIGSRDGVQCYASVVSDDGFSVPDRVRVSFRSAEDAYVGDCVTLPEFRGQGAYPCGLVELGHRLRSEGKTRLYLFVERENLASIRSIEKAGFERVAVCSVSGSGGGRRRRWRFLPTSSGTTEPQWTVDVFPSSRRADADRAPSLPTDAR